MTQEMDQFSKDRPAGDWRAGLDLLQDLLPRADLREYAVSP